MTIKNVLFTFIAITAVLLLASCAAGANPTVDMPDTTGISAGFWLGLWHGFIAPVTFVVSLFSDSISIYEVHNNGNWYNFGFMFGVSIILGGGARGAKRKSKDAPQISKVS